MYLNDWKDSGFLGMVKDFEGTYDDDTGAEAAKGERWQGLNVLLASYGTEDYGGDAFVLFVRSGRLYEVHGSHCLCYGLGEQDYIGDRKTQWEPEETTLESLWHRLDKGELGKGYNGNEYANELRQVLTEAQNITLFQQAA